MTGNTLIRMLTHQHAGMRILWAPWRMEYIKSEKTGGCIFCVKPKENRDKENLILYRGERSFIILNRYPYNNGHLMVAPYRHLSELEMLDRDEMTEIMMLLSKSIVALKKEYNPNGFNVGVNIGRAAGAGIEDHIHFHVVPRWVGDTNYMPVLSETKVLPQLLQETYEKLVRYFR